MTSADFGRASAGLGHLIKDLQIRNPSSLRRGLDTLIKFLHKSGLLSSLRREIQVCRFSLPPLFILSERQRQRHRNKEKKWDDAIYPADFMGDGMILGFWNYREKR